MSETASPSSSLPHPPLSLDVDGVGAPPLHGLRILWTESCYELLATVRQLDFTLPTLLFPGLFYLFFGVLFGRGNGMSEYLVATYATFGVVGTALFSFGVGTAVARESGEWTLKGLTPMPAGTFLLAKAVVAWVFCAVVLIELFALAAWLGHVRFGRGQWLAMAGILLIGSIPFAALGAAIGAHTSGKGAPSVLNLFHLPAAFLSGLWIPVTMLPDSLQYVALAFPHFHLAQLALATVGMDLGRPWPLHVGALAIVTVASLGLAASAYRR